jgi:nicotinamidase/pyrazinamidase
MNTVFIDVDTQYDFVAPAGALYSAGAESVIASIAQLTKYAAAKGIPIVSTVDAHLENDPEFRAWKPHCIVDTGGQQKVVGTILDKPYVLPLNADALDSDAARAARQIVVEKRHIDCFTNPNLEPLLQLLGPSQFVVYGVVTEVCVLKAAEGLLKRGHPVQIVTDAVCPFSSKHGEQALDLLVKRGAALTTLATVVS